MWSPLMKCQKCQSHPWSQLSLRQGETWEDGNWPECMLQYQHYEPLNSSDTHQHRCHGGLQGTLVELCEGFWYLRRHQRVKQVRSNCDAWVRLSLNVPLTATMPFQKTVCPDRSCFKSTRSTVLCLLLLVETIVKAYINVKHVPVRAVLICEGAWG